MTRWSGFQLPDGHYARIRAERDPHPLPGDHPDALPGMLGLQLVVLMPGAADALRIPLRRGWEVLLPPELAPYFADPFAASRSDA